VSIQFHFTGAGGYDWYVVSDKGQVSKHRGLTEKPQCILKVSKEDWEKIVRGELNRLEAWSSGRLLADGDLGLMTGLEEAIAKCSLEEWD